MALFLLDTNMVSAVMADHPKVKAKLAQQPGLVVTCATVWGEIRYGLERLPTGKRRSNLTAKAMLVLSVMPIEPITETAADHYGVIRRATELLGFTLSDNDLWIAAASLSLGATLVSNDQDYRRIPGLQIEDWTV